MDQTAYDRIVSRNDLTALVNVSGCSRLERWAAAGIVWMRAPLMVSAISFASAGGVNPSSSPTMTRVGQVISFKRVTESGRYAIAMRSQAIPETIARDIMALTFCTWYG